MKEIYVLGLPRQSYVIKNPDAEGRVFTDPVHQVETRLELYKRALCDPDKTRNEALLRISFGGFLLADLLLLDFLHDKLLNLAGDGGGEALDKLHVAGDLEVRQLKIKHKTFN